MNPDKIGKFIYKLRTEKKLSQYQLADMIPISRQAVSKWERGQTIPDSSTLIRLSDIFHVTINELLNGERLDNNSIQELEITTLSIVDESNRKSKKIRKIMVIFIISIVVFLLSFLSYYFINSYNTIKVYTTGADSEMFNIHEGVFITAKQKTYMKLGKIIPKEDTIINKVRVYYKKDNKEKLIFENEQADITIIDLYGYQEYFPEKDIKDIVKNTYVEITYDDTKHETIHLKYKRDFVNNFLQFTQKPFYKEEQKTTITSTLVEQEAINYIKENGIYHNEGYVLTIKNENIIVFSYLPKMNQLIMNENGSIKWTVIIESKEQYICLKESNRIINNECYRIIKEDIYNYLLKGRT